MGSQSDWKTISECEPVLKKIGISYEKKIISAHRTPERLYEYAKNLKSSNVEVVIAGAGGAAVGAVPSFSVSTCCISQQSRPAQDRSAGASP